MSSVIKGAAPHLRPESAIPMLTRLCLTGPLIEAEGERKRKAQASNAAPRAHWGLAVDSAARLSLIAVSRLLRSPDEQLLDRVAVSPLGAALLAALRAAVLRVAVATGCADMTLGETSVGTLFNLSGSTFANQSRYEATSGLTLPTKLPWPCVKVLVRALLDSLTVSLLTPEGSLLQRSMLTLPSSPLDAAAQTTIAALVAIVERETTSRLLNGGAGSSSSSSVQPSQPPLPSAPPQALVLPQPIDATMSFASSVRRVVQGRLGRPMTVAESGTLDAAAMEALSLLLPGGEAVRRERLDSNVLSALSTPAAAQLWACTLEAAEPSSERSSGFAVDVFAAALVEATSAIAGVQLARTFGI
jgi:hypothetical protein